MEHGFTIHPLYGIQRIDRLQQMVFEFVQRGRQTHRPCSAVLFEPAQARADTTASDEGERFVAVIEIPPVESAITAVGASIVAAKKKRKPEVENKAT
jgi:hypothetical protein